MSINLILEEKLINTLADFQIKLSYETWDSVFNGEDVNVIFNSFLNTYMRIFYSSFPLTKKKLQKILHG
jgi:hypothetical protein